MIFVLGVKRVTPLTLTQRPQLAQYRDIWLAAASSCKLLALFLQYFAYSVFGALCHYKHVKTTVLTSCLTPPPLPTHPCCLGTKDHTRVKARTEVLMSGCKVLL